MTNNKVKLILLSTSSEEQIRKITRLQKLCFVNVNNNEAKEDFYHTPLIQILAYIENKLVGWAGIHITEQTYNGKLIKLGGYGVCTHPDFRKMGVATNIAEKAMNYLKEKGCDIGFLSVNPNDEKSIKLHLKFGFVMLPQHFSWKDSKGILKEDKGGMIAPILSDKLFTYVLNGSSPLHVGNGYW